MGIDVFSHSLTSGQCFSAIVSGAILSIVPSMMSLQVSVKSGSAVVVVGRWLESCLAMTPAPRVESRMGWGGGR